MPNPVYFAVGSTLNIQSYDKSVKGKPDKVDFVINIGAPTAATGFSLKFGMETSGKAYIGKAGTDTLPPSAPWSHTKLVAFNSPVGFGDTFQLEGVGYKGKKIDVSVAWATSPKFGRWWIRSTSTSDATGRLREQAIPQSSLQSTR